MSIKVTLKKQDVEDILMGLPVESEQSVFDISEWSEHPNMKDAFVKTIVLSVGSLLFATEVVKSYVHTPVENNEEEENDVVINTKTEVVYNFDKQKFVEFYPVTRHCIKDSNNKRVIVYRKV